MQPNSTSRPVLEVLEPLMPLAGVRVFLRRALGNERGAVMAEYGLLLALVALMLVAMLVAFGDTVVDMFSAMSSALSN